VTRRHSSGSPATDRRKPAFRNGARIVAALLLAWGGAVSAGPPFVSDDPEPTDSGHWEIYGFAGGTHIPGETAGATGFDINYGGARDLQLTAVVPLDYRTGREGAAGIGDIELAAKYKFLHQSDGSPLPDVAFFPRVFLPSGGHRFGSGRVSLLLPLWAQKDFGKWSLFGGGGYDLNPGLGQRNFWLTGIGLQRSLSERFALGAEIYHQTPDAEDAHRFTGVNLGALYRLDPHWSLLGSAGPGLEHARTEGRYSFYLALKADY
jgi:hypothetical protein